MVPFHHKMLCVQTVKGRVSCLKLLLEQEKRNLKSWMPYKNHIWKSWEPGQNHLGNFCMECMEP